MTEGSVSQIKAKVKVVLLGDQSTGKTSIITRFINNRFQPDIGPTVGIDFLAKNLSINNYIVRLQLWDTAGQQRFRSLIPNYLKDALVAILVFDLSNRRTFENLNEWIELFQENKHEKAVLFLVGNKGDLQVREVAAEEAGNRARQLGVEYMETSAKTSMNIERLFQRVAKAVVSRETEKESMMASNVRREETSQHPLPVPPRNSLQSQPIQLNQPKPQQKKKSKCSC